MSAVNSQYVRLDSQAATRMDSMERKTIIGSHKRERWASDGAHHHTHTELAARPFSNHVLVVDQHARVELSRTSSVTVSVLCSSNF